MCRGSELEGLVVALAEDVVAAVGHERVGDALLARDGRAWHVIGEGDAPASRMS